MTIDDFKENAIIKLDQIDGVDNAFVDDFNSESLVMFISIDRKANLKKVTPAIKRALREVGVSDNLIESWAPPSPKDQWGDRESYDYEIDIAYAYAQTPKEDVSDLPDIMVFSGKKYGNTPYANDDLEKIFKETYENNNFNNEHEHVANIETRLEGYEVLPLYDMDHTEQSFHFTRQDRWDSSFLGAVAVKEKSKHTPESVLSELNEWLNPDRNIKEETNQEIPSTFDEEPQEESITPPKMG